MTVEKLAETLGFKVFTLPAGLDRTVSGVYCCDLLSMAMGRAPEGSAWVTVMGNVNVVAVAALADVACVIIAGGVEPDGAAVEKAAAQGVSLLGSGAPVFETAKSVDKML